LSRRNKDAVLEEPPRYSSTHQQAPAMSEHSVSAVSAVSAATEEFVQKGSYETHASEEIMETKKDAVLGGRKGSGSNRSYGVKI